MKAPGNRRSKVNLTDPAEAIRYFEKLLRTQNAKQWLDTSAELARHLNALAAVINYYHSLNCVNVSEPAYAATSAATLPALIGGFTDEDLPQLLNGWVLLPRSYLAKFPETEQIHRDIREHKANLDSKFRPMVTVVGRHGINTALTQGGQFKRNTGSFDYWPTSFSTRLDVGNKPVSLSRDQLAAVLIDDIISKYEPHPPCKHSRNNSAITLGSCFAVNIAQALEMHGIRCRSIRVEEIVNSARANRILLEYVLHNSEPETTFFSETISSADRDAFRQEIEKCSIAILTIGVAPVLEWVGTGHLYLGHRSKELLRSGQIRQRMTTVDENATEIITLIDLLVKANPSVDVFLTLSPVPLIGTADGKPIVVADLISKSTLRLAIEQARIKRSFRYWPSFEIVKWAGAHVGKEFGYQAYGEDDNNSRHVSKWLVDVITTKFIDYAFA